MKLKLGRKYQPNLSDPRIKSRVAKVIAWCQLTLREKEPKPINNKKLEEVFGGRGERHKLSVYLRDRLLIQSGHYKPQAVCKPGERGTCYSYALNKTELDLLKAEFKAANPTEAVNIAVCLPDDTLRQLAAKDFTYKVDDNRSYHPLQNMPSAEKGSFWKQYGFDHHYDIEAAAPTLLVQTALKLGWPAKRLDVITDYINDRHSFRQHIADVAGCDLLTAKKIAAALFGGAIFNYRGAIYQRLLNCDKAKLEALKNDHRIRLFQLRSRALWQKLGVLLKRDLKTGTDKAAFYRELENQVITVARVYLEDKNIKYFLEHDGFITDAPVDLDDLQQAIKHVEGFDLKFSKVN